MELLNRTANPSTGSGAPQIQRLFGKKKKPTTDKTMFDTGKAPEDAFFTVRAAVKTGTASRSERSLTALLSGGTGHSWLEIELGPKYPSLEALEQTDDGALIAQTLEPSTRTLLEGEGKTTVGFYPNVTGTSAISKKTIAKQLFVNIPGKITEPEQAHFAGSERGQQGFPVTDAAQAITLFSFIRQHRTHSYNVLRYNCTDFVIKAIKSIGYSLGDTSNALGWTLPTLMYKQIYKRSELGDRSAGYTPLSNAKNKKGKTYDTKHVGKKTEKRLEKSRQKVAPKLQERARKELWARAIATYTAPGFLSLRSGMMRQDTKFGVTGVIQGDPLRGWGEIIMQGGTDWVDLKNFYDQMGFPYPNAGDPNAQVDVAPDRGEPEEDRSQEEFDQPLPKEEVDEFIYMDFPDLEEMAQEEERENPKGQEEAPQIEQQPTQDEPPVQDHPVVHLPAPRTVVNLKAPLAAITVGRYGGGVGRRVTVNAGDDVYFIERKGNDVDIETQGYGFARATIDAFLAAIGQD